MLKIARLKPRRFDPESPIIIFAGKKLYFKNPKHDPANAIENKQYIIFPELIKITEKLNKVKIQTPVASPSSPSNQFIAFVIPTIQNIVKVKFINIRIEESSPPKKGIFIGNKLTPLRKIIEEIIIWVPNLMKGLTSIKSSIKPTK